MTLTINPVTAASVTFQNPVTANLVGSVGIPQTWPVWATGNSGVVNYTATGLPTGFSVGPAGISGVSVVPVAKTNVTVTGTDASGATGIVTCTLTVQ